MDYALHIVILLGIYFIWSLSLNLMVGYTGLAVLGQIGFAAIGAYTTTILSVDYSINGWIAIILGSLLAGAVGLIIGCFSLRLKGDYLALATFGFAIVTYQAALNWNSLTYGPIGITDIARPKIWGIDLDENIWFLILVYFCLLFTWVLIKRLIETPFGLLIKSIREDELASQSIGVDISEIKMVIFSIGSVLSGLGGGLYAYYIRFIDPSSFVSMESITILLMIILGGLGTLIGPLIGTAIIFILPEALKLIGMPSAFADPARQMIFGLILILIMIFKPNGIANK